MKKINFPWGELIIVAETKKFSIGIDTINPHQETDKKGAYLKKGRSIIYVLEGIGLCANKPMKEGDILQISEGDELNLHNHSSKKLVVMTVYIPPYNEKNIGYKN